MSKKAFNAYEYAAEFESLSLEIIEIEYFGSSDHKEIITKAVTQATRDNGIDGYITFKINNTFQTYTVEAKLRTSKTLGLKDFASSILYSLINFSTRHFVVTNISYSKEAYKVIQSINHQNKGNIDLIDGKKLQDIINKKLEFYNTYSKSLLDYIYSRNFSETKHIRPINIEPEAVPDIRFFLTDYLLQMDEKIISNFKYGSRCFIIDGTAHTGKSVYISHVIKKISIEFKKTAYYIDLAVLTTPRLLCLKIFEIVLNIDILTLIDYLNSDDTDQILAESAHDLDKMKNLGLGFKILFDADIISNDQHFFYLTEVLSRAISANYMDDSYILYFYNMDKASKSQIFFLMKILYIFSKHNITTFFELLIPYRQQELKNISIEDWLDICIDFKRNKYFICDPVSVTLKNYTKEEKLFLIKQCIEHNLSEKFYSYLRDRLSDLPKTFYLELDYVISHKLFTIPLLNNYMDQINNSGSLYEAAYYDYQKDPQYSELLQYAICFAYLLDGIIPQEYIVYISKKFHCKVDRLLANTIFFVYDRTSLRIIDENIYKIDQIINREYLEISGKDILSTLDFVYVSKYERAYYTCLLHVIAERKLKKEEIIQCMQELKKRNAVSRMEKVLYETFLLSQEKKYDIEIVFQIALAYLKFTNKQFLYDHPHTRNVLEVSMLIYEELQYYDSKLENRHSHIKLLLNYCEIMFYREKMNYNYNKCLHYVEDMLMYENNFTGFEQEFVNAHLWRALIYKEHGNYNAQFREYIQTIRRYPQNKKLNCEFKMNAAAYYYYRNTSKALYILNNLVDELNICKESYRNHMWLYHDWIMVKMLNNIDDLDTLHRLRRYAETCNLSNILSRSFNMEGYSFFKHGSLEKALEYFETAVIISRMSGRNKPFFLFLANLAVVKKLMNLSVDEEINETFQWLERNFSLVKTRLLSSAKPNLEHMFAALLSFSQSFENANNNKKIMQLINSLCTGIWQGEDVFSVIHPLYVCNNQIIILF